ncbi:MAG TPA: S46 family peptidase, partial [Polyangiaceae bacterium]|nr:S46 family peptidase [Polyangiaceae bacterium]
MMLRPLSTSVLAALLAAVACGGEVKTYRLPAQPPAPPPKPSAQPPAPSFESPGGMWLPSQLGSAHAETLRKLGLELEPEKLADPMAYPLGAVISLGGCSASFVSPDGLVITNHHCVTAALQYNSTPEKNLLELGYVAKGFEDEPSIGPTGRVFVTQAFHDVTARMRDGIEQIADDKARHDAMEKREKEIIAECEKAKSDVRCEVASYFGGAQYLSIERLEIKDVRLVYAPAEGVGNFGGEIDNWRWPRHGGDFSFYRAYVGKDGKPGEYAKDNVPYKPRQHLKLPSKPLGAGDLVFVAGYPGRSYRLYTAYETEEAVNWYYPYRVRFCEELLTAVDRAKKGDADVAIKATPLERGLNNALTYTRGTLEGLSQGGAADQRRKAEQELEGWVNADPARQKMYADAFAKLHDAFAEQQKTRDLDAVLGEMLRIPSLLGATFSIVRLAEERPKPDADRDPDYQERNWQRLEQTQQALEKRYSRKLDVATLSEIAARAKRLLPADQRALLLRPLTGQSDPTLEQIATAV